MCLNGWKFDLRRLFAWLLGSEVQLHVLSQEHPLVKYSEGVASTDRTGSNNPYFQMYSKPLLVEVSLFNFHW